MRAPRVDASHTSHTVLPSPRACPLCAAPLPRSARPSRRRGRSGTKKSGRSKERRACTRAGSARTRVRLPPPLPQPPSWRLTRYWNCPRRQTWCPAQVRRPRLLPRPPGRLRLSTSCPHSVSTCQPAAGARKYRRNATFFFDKTKKARHQSKPLRPVATRRRRLTTLDSVSLQVRRNGQREEEGSCHDGQQPDPLGAPAVRACSDRSARFPHVLAPASPPGRPLKSATDACVAAGHAEEGGQG
jgi:hypothetical protein